MSAMNVKTVYLEFKEILFYSVHRCLRKQSVNVLWVLSGNVENFIMRG